MISFTFFKDESAGGEKYKRFDFGWELTNFASQYNVFHQLGRPVRLIEVCHYERFLL